MAFEKITTHSTSPRAMGSNMGILPPLPEKIKGKAERYGALAARAMQDLEQTLRDLEA